MLDDFELKDLSLMKYFPGIQVKQAKGKKSFFVFGQEKYIEDLLKKFYMFKCKSTPSLMGLNENLKHDKK